MKIRLFTLIVFICTIWTSSALAQYGEFRTIVTGSQHSCGLSPQGVASCWGNTTPPRPTANGQTLSANPSSDGIFVKYSAAPVAITRYKDGEPWPPFVSLSTAIGRGNCGLTQAGRRICWSGFEDKAPRPRDEPPRAYVQLAPGMDHDCALTVHGTIMCWGRGYHGQLGQNILPWGWSSTPDTVDLGPLKATSVVSSGDSSCGLLEDGTVWCWGHGWRGQLGNGTAPFAQRSPVQVKGLSGVYQMAAGAYHLCAATRDDAGSHEVYCWGGNGHGQLANEPRLRFAAPMRMPALSGMKIGSLSLGTRHSCLVTTEHKGFCWGSGHFGQLGDGSRKFEYKSLVPIMADEDLRTIAAGGYHTCYTTMADAGYCFGFGDRGQIGDGRYRTAALKPVRVLAPIDKP